MSVDVFPCYKPYLQSIITGEAGGWWWVPRYSEPVISQAAASYSAQHWAARSNYQQPGNTGALLPPTPRLKAKFIKKDILTWSHNFAVVNKVCPILLMTAAFESSDTFSPSPMFPA